MPPVRMKSNASTQTRPVAPPPLLDHTVETNDIVMATDGIVRCLRKFEESILKTVGAHADGQPTQSGGARYGYAFDEGVDGANRHGSMSDKSGSHDIDLDQRLRMRLAASIRQSARAAEDDMLAELAKMTALIPHGEAGYGYARARLSPNRRRELQRKEEDHAKVREAVERNMHRTMLMESRRAQQERVQPALSVTTPGTTPTPRSSATVSPVVGPQRTPLVSSSAAVTPLPSSFVTPTTSRHSPGTSLYSDPAQVATIPPASHQHDHHQGPTYQPQSSTAGHPPGTSPLRSRRAQAYAATLDRLLAKQ